MKIAYVDTSSLLSVALTEPGFERELERMRGFDRLLSSNLLEAEYRSAVRREGVVEPADDLLDWISWVLPARELGPEFSLVLGQRLLRGADLWHVACALYLRHTVPALSFLSLDRRQIEVAANLGLATAG